MQSESVTWMAKLETKEMEAVCVGSKWRMGEGKR